MSITIFTQQAGCLIFLLQSFLKLYKQSFVWAAQTAGPPVVTTTNSGPHEADIVARNALLSDKLVELVHAAVSRAMFNKDQLALAVHLARNLLPNQFPPEEWTVFLNCSSSLSGGAANAGGSTANKRGSGSRPGTAAPATPSWVRPECADAYEQIQAALPNLVATAQLQEGRIWAAWAASTASVVGVGGGIDFVPSAVAARLSGLQQLILVAAFRPDR